MTVEADIFSALTGLVSGRVWPSVNTSDPQVTPYITYQQVGGDPLSYCDAVMPNLRNGRFQVRVWSGDFDVVTSLMRQAETVMVESAALTAESLGGPVSVYEDDTRLHGSLQFFSIWF